MNASNIRICSVILVLTALVGIGALWTQSAQAQCVSPPSNLVSWWRGEGNATDVADGNHGTLQNGATFAPGRVGQAFSFDGANDYVLVPHSPSLNIGIQFSVELWFRADPSQTSYRTLVDKSHRSSKAPPYYSGWTVQMDPAGLLRFGFGYGTGWAIASTNTSVRDGVWHHFAATYDGVAVRAYLDGVLTQNIPVPGAPVHNSGAMAIGRWEFGRSRNFRGDIDEVTLYATALSNAEVQAIHNAGSAGKCTCLGDLNEDDAIGLSDLTILLSHFGTPSGASYADGDFDADGDVDIQDLASLLANFGTTCP